ncbi:MAG: hypothetical protein H7Y86_19955 [Rhizobacter sp.]|nr:hypothetical protein [Ferruginibacter sp.]
MKFRFLHCFFLMLATALVYLTSCVIPQMKTRTYVFKEIGWKINVPVDFLIEEPDNAKALETSRKKLQENSSDSITWSPEISFIKVKKDEANVLSSTIASYKLSNEKNFEEQRYKSLLLVTNTFLNQPEVASVDTSRSTVDVGGIQFFRFHFNVKYDNGLNMHTLLYSRIFRGYEVPFISVIPISKPA